MSNQSDRADRLMPGGIPRYVRCYDNGGKTFDRYTVVYTRRNPRDGYAYRGMSAHPTHPQGFGMFGVLPQKDGPYLGKRIAFNTLPEECQKVARADYRDIWNLR